MSASKIVATASGVLFAVGLGVIVWALRDRESTVQTLSQWSAKEASMREGVARARAAETKARKDAEMANAAAIAPKGKPSTAPRAGRNGPPDWSLILAKHPELQADFEKAFAANKAHEYAPIYAKLHLTQDQIDKLDQLMVKDQENTWDLQGTAQAQGLPMSDPSIAQMRKQQQADLTAQEQQVVGPDDYPALQTFNNEAPLRNSVRDAATFAIAQGIPFTADQEEQMTELLAQTSASFQQNPAKPLNANSVNWDAALAQAQSFLTPQQISALHAEGQFAPLMGSLKQFYSQQSTAAK